MTIAWMLDELLFWGTFPPHRWGATTRSLLMLRPRVARIIQVLLPLGLSLPPRPRGSGILRAPAAVAATRPRYGRWSRVLVARSYHWEPLLRALRPTPLRLRRPCNVWVLLPLLP